MNYIFKYSKRDRCKAKLHQKLDSRVLSVTKVKSFSLKNEYRENN